MGVYIVRFKYRFQDLPKVKNPLSAKQSSNNYLQLSKKICFEEYDGVTLAMLHFKVLHDMVSQNPKINLSEAAIMSQKYMY